MYRLRGLLAFYVARLARAFWETLIYSVWRRVSKIISVSLIPSNNLIPLPQIFLMLFQKSFLWLPPPTPLQRYVEKALSKELLETRSYFVWQGASFS